MDAIRNAGASHDPSAVARTLADAIAKLVAERSDFGTMRGREAEITTALARAADDRDVWLLGEILLRVAETAFSAWSIELGTAERFREQSERVADCAQRMDLPGTCRAYGDLCAIVAERSQIRRTPPTPTTDGARISLGTLFSISFQRTLRIPDDGKTYPLPPGLGAFPVARVADYAERVPAEWRRGAGFFIPLYQREALWMSFAAEGHRPVAVKIAIGGVSAISGARESERLTRRPQDYVVCPKQPWLDGIGVGDGTIRQFVAMPLGMGYTVEGQITGQESRGGVQITVYAARPGKALDRPHRTLQLPLTAAEKHARWEALLRQRFGPPPTLAPMAPAAFGAPMPAMAAPAPGSAMGLGGGGRIKQQIFDDTQPADYWDDAPAGAFEVHIVNSTEYHRITGKAPPPSPVSAHSYSSAGFPWFDYYDEKSTAIDGTQALKDVRSIAQIDQSKGLGLQPEDLSVEIAPGQLVDLSPGGEPAQRDRAARRAHALMTEQRWEEALAIHRVLARTAPEDPVHTFNASLCLFQLRRFADARQMQLGGPPEQWDRPDVSHNMACIEVALGNLDAALRYARRAIQLGPDLRGTLLADPDLAPLHEKLRTS